MEIIPYKIRAQRSKTPCPNGMKATCDRCKINKPVLVHVGSWMEWDCPFYQGEGEQKNTTLCDFIPDTFTVYNSR